MDNEHKLFLNLLNQEKELKEQLKQTQQQIKEKEAYYLKQIKMGKAYPWCWKYNIYKTNISWKEKFIEYLGKKKADEISSTTPQTVYPHIGVLGFHQKEGYKKKITKFTLKKPRL